MDDDVTRILCAIEGGDPRAAAELLPLLYAELRKLAAQRMAAERADHTLQPTALVHEAYLRLVGGGGGQNWSGRGHFFAAAAEAMRRILVENARRKNALRRGGDRQRVDLSHVEPVARGDSDDVLALNDALEKLGRKDRVKCELVKLRYFAGLTVEQAAEALGISPATAHRHWNYARAWLHQEVAGEPGEFRQDS
jgi:RNA polymerase sigma factor (TIGR02999 family)